MKNYFLIISTLLLFATSLFAQLPETFSTSSTWTAPSGVTQITVECWGAGGAPLIVPPGNARPGGGGGAYAKKLLLVTPGQTYTISVGTGSVGSPFTPALVDSWFESETTVLAKGGADGNSSGGAGGSSANSVGDLVFSGGNGAPATSNAGGGGGSSGGFSSDGTNAISNTGGVAPTGGGDGGNGGVGIFAAETGHSPGGGSGGRGASTNASFTSNSSTGTVTSTSGANGMIIISDSSIPLPVELTNLEVKQTLAEGARLNWETASETNNSGFEIQRSKDGQDWQTLAFVEGKGTTSEKQSYEYVDRSPEMGVNYYRLNQLDHDGASSYSDVVAVALESAGLAQAFYPNPAKDFIFFPNVEEGVLRLTDVTGREVARIRFSNSNADVSMLPSGTYYGTFVDGLMYAPMLIVKE